MTGKQPPTPELLVFCDTEFTDMFDPGAELISIALVAVDGEEIYLENKSVAQAKCSTFVHDEVLPQLQRTSDVCASYPKIGEKLSAWLATRGAPVTIVYDAEIDWIKLNETFMRKDGSTIRPSNLVRQIAVPHPDIAHSLPAEQSAAAVAFYQAIDDYYLVYDVPKHHARNDARAMREAWLRLQERGLARHLFAERSAYV